MELVLMIVIGLLFSMFKKAADQEKRRVREPQNHSPWEQTLQRAPKQVTRTTPVREQLQRGTNVAQVHEGRMETKNTTILQRAKANVEEDKVDVTLHTMEAEHNHSERVAPATHHHPEDVIPENVLGTVEDLMVKGYDGNLCFERDFVGEAMDMISRFTVPSTVPDYSKNDVA